MNNPTPRDHVLCRKPGADRLMHLISVFFEFKSLLFRPQEKWYSLLRELAPIGSTNRHTFKEKVRGCPSVEIAHLELLADVRRQSSALKSQRRSLMIRQCFAAQKVAVACSQCHKKVPSTINNQLPSAITTNDHQCNHKTYLFNK
jgi:hypothetical protein